MTFGVQGQQRSWSLKRGGGRARACTGATGSLGARLDARVGASASRRARVTSTGRELPGCTGAGTYKDRCRDACESSQVGASAGTGVRRQTRESVTERLDAGAVTAKVGCPNEDEDEYEPSILDDEDPRTLMVMVMKLECCLERLGDILVQVCKRAREGAWAKGRLPLGSPWVPRPMRKNREEARVSIGQAFEAHGSN
ncbi:hypothetical protein CRG98_022908 [Punica granatum]|uniref:Uncharacterized protein n=1 Tax=Punica granatum TaxID=22663 RepID=A0A2I0JKA3_PUNGR|nr:hypothetical protein CRG98_022908 [Punica granatum]